MNIEKLIEEMTIDEKIGQMSQAFLDESKSISDSMLKQIEKGEIGSVILSATAVAGNVDDGLSSTIVEDIKNAEKKRLSISLLSIFFKLKTSEQYII